jgi:hypothetical protein
LLRDAVDVAAAEQDPTAAISTPLLSLMTGPSDQRRRRAGWSTCSP